MEMSLQLWYNANTMGSKEGMISMNKLQYTFKTDTLFKMLFVKHEDLLKKLVAALLGISVDSIQQFTVCNPKMPPEALGDKCRVILSSSLWRLHAIRCCQIRWDFIFSS